MIVLYFASLKEQLLTDSDIIDLTTNTSVLELKKQLSAKYNYQFIDNNIICAINYSIADNDDIIKNDDEVAFYPPVTGG